MASWTAGASIARTDTGLHPEAIGEPALPDELQAAPRTGLRSQLLLREVELLGLAARDALDRDVALLVVERREQVRHRGQRVGERTAELA